MSLISFIVNGNHTLFAFLVYSSKFTGFISLKCLTLVVSGMKRSLNVDYFTSEFICRDLDMLHWIVCLASFESNIYQAILFL